MDGKWAEWLFSLHLFLPSHDFFFWYLQAPPQRWPNLGRAEQGELRVLGKTSR